MSLSASCEHFPLCGGCTSLDFSYEKQLAGKHAQLLELFSDTEVQIPTVIPSPQPFYYRHKVQLPFGFSAKHSGKGLTLGCYAADSHRVIDQKQCLIQDPDLTAVVHAVRFWAGKTGLGVYEEKRNSGFFRHVLLRRGLQTGEILVGLVTNGPRPVSSRNLARSLIMSIEKQIDTERSRVVGVVQSVNTRSTNVVIGSREEVWWGRPFLKEKLGPYMFKVGISTFFQVNPYQTPQLYNEVLKWVPQGASVLDVYCGVGTISLWLSQKASQVIGIEENEQSIREARESARNNGVKNVSFRSGDASVLLPQYADSFDVVVVDPPRRGLEGGAMSALKTGRLKRRIIYVSCNPQTLHRDIKMLGDKYRVVSLVGVDMFPQTGHVECVGVLEPRT